MGRRGVCLCALRLTPFSIRLHGPSRSGSTRRPRGWLRNEGGRRRWQLWPTPVAGLSAGSLREPPRRISFRRALQCPNAAPRIEQGAGRASGPGDAPWSGRGAPARSAPLRHCRPGIPRVPVGAEKYHPQCIMRRPLRPQRAGERHNKKRHSNKEGAGRAAGDGALGKGRTYGRVAAVIGETVSAFWHSGDWSSLLEGCHEG